jgi:hypothetical protein
VHNPSVSAPRHDPGVRRAARRREVQKELLSALRRRVKLEQKIERLKEELHQLSVEEDQSTSEA